MLISRYTTKRSFSGYQQGFTLIELLVVIAIIGILASVVLASLNTARTKGQIASIKSNLKNIIPQAELAYDVPGNYSTVCTDTKVAGMLTAITNAGGTTGCYTRNDPGYSDVYLRWGVSALLGTSTPLQAYSVSSTGVTTWDVQGVTTSGISTTPDVTMTWDQANTACSTAGDRLPTIEELYILSQSSYKASTNTSYTPPGFIANQYWSNTTVPSNLFLAYHVNTSNGTLTGSDNKTNTYYVRCVR